MAKYKLTTHGQYVRDAETGGLLATVSDEYQQWLSEGNIPDPADQPPALVVYKEKNSIILQLIAAGKMPAARAILSSPGMEDSRDLWDGAYKIAYDDASVRGLLTAVGMDAEDVMSKATAFGG